MAAPVVGHLRRIALKAGDRIDAAGTVVAVLDPIAPVPLDARSRALASIGAASSRQLSPLAPNAALVRLGSGRTTAAALTALDRNPNVRYVEPNYVVHHEFASDDTYYTNGSLWGMKGGAAGSNADVAWAADKTGNNSVVVGIIDEGVMFDHPDLAANTGTNPGEIAGNGKDDDANGLVDDVSGWDFAGNDRKIGRAHV